MTKVVHISTHGLTGCPSCKRHIYVAEDWRETHCPFCEAALIEPKASAPASIRTKRAGRIAAGVVSAVLVGMGCGNDVYGSPPMPMPSPSADAEPRDAGAADSTPATPTPDAGEDP